MPLDASLNSDDVQVPELQFDESPKVSKDEERSGALEAVGALSTCSNDQSTSKTLVHMVSEFVIELLQALEVPESQIDELVAQLEFCKPVESDSDSEGEFSDNLVMVQLCEIANRIIANRDEADIKLEHSAQSVRL